MKRIYLLILCCCALLSTSAQYNSARNNVWAFGNGAGLDFSSGAPVPIHTSSFTWEGTASVCNTAGSLLFYTDGVTVYNRLHLVMPGGAAIVPFFTTSITQAAVIMPVINHPTRYYLFTLGTQLTYTIIDMALDGGLGDVVPGSVGISITSGWSEKMIAIPGNGCNIWLMHRYGSQFHAYEITSSGISTTPVISSMPSSFGIIGAYGIGVIKCSHDGQKIASACYPNTGTGGIELFDFNPTTGIVSNIQLLETSTMSAPNYGAEFSPDNTKLYTADDSSIYQWDITLPTTAAIIASKTLITPSETCYYGDLKLGPDGKIYIPRIGDTFIDCISLPNAAAAGCGFTPYAVNVSPGTARWSLSNMVWSAQSIIGPVAICAGETATFTASTGSGVWNSSNPAIATVGSSSGVVGGVAPGTVVMSYSSSSCTSTTIVTVNPATPAGSSGLCVGGSIPLTGSTPGGTWASNNTAVATVGLATGIVYGVAPGTVNIYHYNGTSPCPEVVTITVSALPGSVNGKLQLCETFSTILNCTPAGGTWSCSSPSATISSSGAVTGIAAGTAMVTYTMPGGCFSTAIVSVNPLPAAITGPATVATGATITLSNSSSGGSWSSSDSTKAQPNTMGTITGMSPGTATIYYTLPTGCKVSVVVTVTGKNPVSIASFDAPKPILYPNPATNEIVIKAEQSEFTSFTIYNAVGQQVAMHEVSDAEMTVNVKAFPPGEYQVMFKGTAAREVIRFIKW